MDEFQIALAIGAVVAVALNYGQPRAWLWVFVGAADFIATAIYQAYPLSTIPHAFVTCMVDGAVVALLSIYGRLGWEIWVRRCFMLSMLMSILFLSHYIPSVYAYVTLLEICNWLALLVIGGDGIARALDAHVDHRALGYGPRGLWGRAVHRARVHLDSPRPASFLARAFTRY